MLQIIFLCKVVREMWVNIAQVNNFLVKCWQRLYLLKRGTTWNQLKPPETTQKLLETTWNQPYYSRYLLLKINYSQFEFVLILHPKVFFGQIWSQKLKFSKVLQINWNLVQGCIAMLITILMFIFPKFLSLIFFGQIWSHNLDFFKLTEIS